MKIKEFQLINKISTLYDTEEEILNALLKHLSEENPNITLNEAKEKINTFDQYSKFKNCDSIIQKFKIGGVEFGLIPDFDDMKVAEFLDIDSYDKTLDDIHKLMAVLFRPVTSTLNGKYNIEDYKGSGTYSEVMRDVDVHIYHNVVNFFSALYIQLLEVDTNTSTKNKKK